MKSTIFNCCITLLLSVISLTSAAQTAIPKGKATLIEFTNSNAKFKVPEGKTWYIYNVFGERRFSQGVEEKDSRIFLKSINNINFKFGPLLYYYNTGLTISYPLVFPEKTTFELEMIDLSGNKAVMSYVEVDN
jgi:hypothetical protein